MALVYAPDAENSTVDPVVASTRASVKAVDERMAEIARLMMEMVTVDENIPYSEGGNS